MTRVVERIWEIWNQNKILTFTSFNTKRRNSFLCIEKEMRICFSCITKGKTQQLSSWTMSEGQWEHLHSTGLISAFPLCGCLNESESPNSLLKCPLFFVKYFKCDWHSCPSWRKYFSSSSLSFSSSALHWFYRKFLTTDFSDCRADSSASLRALSNIQSFMNSLFWGPSNIPGLSFSMLTRGNFSWRKANPLPYLSIAFTKSFITPNLICEGTGSI